jgi:hypothetical protein
MNPRVLLFAQLFGVLSDNSSRANTPPRKPNILVIFSDDQGYLFG